MRTVRAFTLIELLVVISILALLVALLLPALASARDTAISLQCASKQRDIGFAFEMYGQEYEDYIPTGSSASNAWGFLLGAAGYFGAYESYQGYLGGSPITLRSFATLNCPGEYGVTAGIGTGAWDIRGATMYNYYTHRNSYAINWTLGGFAPYGDLRKGWSRGPQYGQESSGYPAITSQSEALIVMDRSAYGAGFWDDGSIQYGYDSSFDVQPDAEYAFRHIGTTANALYWDGHVTARAPANGYPASDPSVYNYAHLFHPNDAVVGPVADGWINW